LPPTRYLHPRRIQKIILLNKDDIPENTFSPVDDEIVSDSNSELDDSSEKSDSSLCHTFDVPHQRFNVKEVCDNFVMRKDSLVIFITRTGEPCDLGARMLAEQARLLRIENVLGRAKVIRDKNRYIIALIIEERVSEIINRQIITEAIFALLSVVDEIGLTLVSIY